MPTPDIWPRLPLLDAVVKESMRLLPPVPYTIRTATREAELSNVRVRRGDKLICSHYFTHHMPELYANPQRFQPERWEHLRLDPYAYMPFSTPPRMCIGAGFANSVIKTVVVSLLQRFRPQLLAGQTIDRAARITLAPRAGIQVVLRSPEDGFAARPLRGNIRESVELP